jgi:large subunit ribosomal protein L29
MAKKNERFDELTPNQLAVRLKELQGELRRLRFDRIVASVDDISDIRETRKNIARAKTILREYEMGVSNHDGAYRRRKSRKADPSVQESEE